MMENWAPLTPLDRASSRNSPDRCPSPLFSWNSMRERHKILRCYQYKRLKHIKTEVKEEDQERYLRGDELCKKEEISPEIRTDTRDTLRDINSEEEEEGYVRNKEKPEEPSLMGDEPCKEEEIPPEISTDSGDARVTQAEEEDRQMKTKRKILEIGMDGRYRWYNMEEHPNVPPEGEIVDDDITAYVLEAKAVTPNLKPFSYKEEKVFTCPECGKCFSRKYDRIMHRRIHTGQESFLCPECGKSFPFKSNLEMHQKTHTAQTKPFTCSECGMRFRNSLILATHKRVHGAKTVYKCSQCGLAFIKKSYLKRHEKIHIGLKPY